ncbi:hypothetical protein [Salinibacter ruber]|uniref:hypothetical protein n=1 Tax=Salinibacter ruber TaxID=146919 RepID=UPI002168DBED|nr:hypothetical protein [Salinibacter ruber]MCS3642419.1 hypothetical protein [Salinibacter ruber]
MRSHFSNTSLSRVGVYGLSVATDLDLTPTLPSRSDPPDLHVVAASEPIEFADQDLFYSSPTQDPDAVPAIRLYRAGGRFVARFVDAATFSIGPERIEYLLHDDTYAYALELWLLGTVLAFWLEWQGVPALHASAVALGNGAVGVLASKQGGKTTLAMSLLQQGHTLLTDDLLPLGVEGDAIRGRPGYPQMRMWPTHARHFVDNPHSLRRAHPYTDKRRVPVGPDGLGTFCDDVRPLQALYLPERTDEASIQIQPAAPTKALKAALRHSFLPQLVEAAGWQAYRLNALSQLVEQIPVRRLTYPEGIEYLPRVADAILDAEA